MPLCERCGLCNGPCGIQHGDEIPAGRVYRRRCGLSRGKYSARQAGVVRRVMAAGVTPVAEVSTMDSAGCSRSVRTLASLRKTSSEAQTGLCGVKHLPYVVRCTSNPAVSGIHATTFGDYFRRRQSSQTLSPGEHRDVDARPASHLATSTSHATLAPHGHSYCPGLSSIWTAEGVQQHTVATL